MKAVFLDRATLGTGVDLSALRRLFAEFVVYDGTRDDEIAKRIRDAQFVLTNKVRLNDALIESASELRFIGLTATGTDNIDLAAARRNGIAVANIRAYCTESVVEHVMGSLLMLARSLRPYDAMVKAGEWQQAGQFCMLNYPIRQLSEMTLGIVGYGVLGRAVAEAARAFGMRVLVSARPGGGGDAADRLPFDDVLATADVISLHCPLNDTTRNLFDATNIARMKRGAFLINTARGALIDATALVAALQNGQLGGAAIDVLAQEPPIDGNPLLDYDGDDLLVTPHIAWATDRARQNAVDELAANVAAFVAGASRCRVV